MARRCRGRRTEERLVEKFKLTDAIVIDATEDSHLELVPTAAAQHLQILMKPDITVGVGVGPTISRVVANLHSQRLPQVNVVQLSGGFPETGEGHSHDIVRNMSDVLGAKGIYFHAPTIFPDAATKEAVLDRMTDPGLRAHWSACAMAVVTANPIRTEAMLVKAGFLTRQELAELKRLGAVGSLLANFHDAEGNFIDHDINHRVASIPLDLLRRIPNVIAVNRYKNREVALLGALRTGLVNTVVTDVKAARTLL